MRELRRRAAWFALPFFAILVFGSQWGIIGLPYHWDEAAVYYNPLHEVLAEGFGAFLRPEIFLYHPPGMQLLAWPFYLVLGDHPEAGRIFSGLMASIGLYSTFLIGRWQVNWVFGFLASLLLLSSVNFFPHALQFHADIILFGLGTAYIYAGLTRRFAFALALGLVCGLVRETALALGLALGFFYIIENAKDARYGLMTLVAAAPVIAIGAIFALHRLVTGQFFNHRALVDGHISFTANFLSGLSGVLPKLAAGWFYFLPQVGRGGAEIYLLILLISIFFVKQILNKKPDFAVEWAFVLIFSVFLIFFSFDSGFLPRYFLPAYPFFVLFLLSQLWRLSRGVAGLLVVAALFTNPLGYHEIGADYFPSRSNAFEYSLDFPQMIRMHQEMADYIDSNVPRGSKILTGWPFNFIFLHPRFGYVKNRLTGATDLSAADYILDGSCLPSAERSKFKDKLSLFLEVRKFSRQGMWVALYENKNRKDSWK